MERTLDSTFDAEIALLLESINHKYCYDFRLYSQASIRRTVVHAMNRMGCDTIAILQKRVLTDSPAFDDLIQSLTIPVTEMFRDHTYFLSMREKVFPTLKTYPSLKIWVAGCSSGEEAYSLAIMLQEEELLDRATIFATDINERSLAKAKAGEYSLADMSTASERYLQSGGTHALADYYKSSSNKARIDQSIQKHIVFADHSLVTDTVFAETHLISCRNVLIYFNRDLQSKVFGLFYESLRKNCFLGLGAKETVQFSEYENKFSNFVE